jgi:hypothetical protein
MFDGFGETAIINGVKHERVSIPCPDGIVGCTVSHYKWIPVEESNLKKFKYFVQHDYEIFPTILEIEAKDQIDALRKLADKLESGAIAIGEIKDIKVW